MKESEFQLKYNSNSAFWRWVDRSIMWLMARGFALVIALRLGVLKRQRMSHNNGIAARGSATIVDNPSFPAHAFFAPGKRFPLRVRHATATFHDDAVAGIRSMSFKFADADYHSPFDMQMNTGEIGLFWSAASFIRFARSRKERYAVEYRDYYRQYPDGEHGAQLSLRRNPTSFHNLRFYSKTPFKFVGEDGVLRYAKYRARPLDNEAETGLIEASQWDTPNQRILPNESRGRNYLKDAYAQQVFHGGVKYMLQIQLHEAQPDEDSEVFNCMVPWDQQASPWLDLAILEVDEMLDWTDSNLTSFSLNNMPESLGVLPATSIFDYNSLNYMRANAEIAHRSRIAMYKVLGDPKPIPDDDNRNV